MRVIIGDHVWLALDSFYEASLENYPTLTRETVHAKIDRMLEDLRFDLGAHYNLCPGAEYVDLCKQNRWRVFETEGFHFAFSLEVLPSGEQVIAIKDARHHLLYHD